jgi:dTDP-4-amino-4,6-dideoxygalactose transaminase
VAADTEPVWHLYVVRSPERERLMRALADAGIGSQIHYPIPPHMQGAYADLGFAPEDFPLSRQLADEVFSLPMGPHTPAGAPAAVRAAVAGAVPAAMRG